MNPSFGSLFQMLWTFGLFQHPRLRNDSTALRRRPTGTSPPVLRHRTSAQPKRSDAPADTHAERVRFALLRPARRSHRTLPAGLLDSRFRLHAARQSRRRIGGSGEEKRGAGSGRKPLRIEPALSIGFIQSHYIGINETYSKGFSGNKRVFRSRTNSGLIRNLSAAGAGLW